MIVLAQAGGASDFVIGGDELPNEECGLLLENAARLLAVRSQRRAAEVLRSIPFRLMGASNHFNDQFSVLFATLPMEEYERLRRVRDSKEDRQVFTQIADTVSELGHYVRFIAVELQLQPQNETPKQGGLKPSQISSIVNRYIGVSSGYLGDFTYRTHKEFYADLDLEIDPLAYDGTTRERFIKILTGASPTIQARILEGVLERFPPGSSELRTPDRAAKIRKWIAALRGGTQVEMPDLRITSEVVERALRDAQELTRSSGATSGVDRVHTALHGHLRQVCAMAGMSVSEDASLTDLFKQIREKHPAFANLGPRSDDILRVLKSLAAILDSLNPLRNKASVAHPNVALLPEAEAMLVLNVVLSILHYVDGKVYQRSQGSG